MSAPEERKRAEEERYGRILGRGIALVKIIGASLRLSSVFMPPAVDPVFTVRLTSVAPEGGFPPGCSPGNQFTITPHFASDFKKKGKLNKSCINMAVPHVFSLWSVISEIRSGEDTEATNYWEWNGRLNRDLRKAAASMPEFVELCVRAVREASTMVDGVEAKRQESYLGTVRFAVDAALQAGGSWRVKFCP